MLATLSPNPSPKWKRENVRASRSVRTGMSALRTQGCVRSDTRALRHARSDGAPTGALGRRLLWNDLGCRIAPGALAVGVDGGYSKPDSGSGCQARYGERGPG